MKYMGDNCQPHYKANICITGADSCGTSSVRSHFSADVDEGLRQVSSAGDVGQHERRVLGNATTVVTEVHIEKPGSFPGTKQRSGANKEMTAENRKRARKKKRKENRKKEREEVIKRKERTL
jgi:CelD/BcsL family acetyltransferase involved in cellulose biosynthesis